MATVDPAVPFPFGWTSLTPVDSMEAGADAWEGLPYTGVALPILGSAIASNFALDGNQPPTLVIDGAGVISGTVDEGIFNTFLEQFLKQRGRGTGTIELTNSEYPTPYTIGSGEIIRKDFTFQVSGQTSALVPITETWTIRVGKNMTVDLGGFDIGGWAFEEVPDG